MSRKILKKTMGWDATRVKLIFGINFFDVEVQKPTMAEDFLEKLPLYSFYQTMIIYVFRKIFLAL